MNKTAIVTINHTSNTITVSNFIDGALAGQSFFTQPHSYAALLAAILHVFGRDAALAAKSNYNTFGLYVNNEAIKTVGF